MVGGTFPHRVIRGPPSTLFFICQLFNGKSPYLMIVTHKLINNINTVITFNTIAIEYHV